MPRLRLRGRADRQSQGSDSSLGSMTQCVVREGHTAGPKMQTLTILWENDTEHAPRPLLPTLSTVWCGTSPGRDPRGRSTASPAVQEKIESHTDNLSLFFFKQFSHTEHLCAGYSPASTESLCSRACSSAWLLTSFLVVSALHLSVKHCLTAGTANTQTVLYRDINSRWHFPEVHGLQSKSSVVQVCAQNCVCPNVFRPMLHPADVTGLRARSGT